MKTIFQKQYFAFVLALGIGVISSPLLADDDYVVDDRQPSNHAAPENPRNKWDENQYWIVGGWVEEAKQSDPELRELRNETENLNRSFKAEDLRKEELKEKKNEFKEKINDLKRRAESGADVATEIKALENQLEDAKAEYKKQFESWKKAWERQQLNSDLIELREEKIRREMNDKYKRISREGGGWG